MTIIVRLIVYTRGMQDTMQASLANYKVKLKDRIASCIASIVHRLLLSHYLSVQVSKFRISSLTLYFSSYL
jgi:hypothetical protein